MAEQFTRRIVHRRARPFEKRSRLSVRRQQPFHLLQQLVVTGAGLVEIPIAIRWLVLQGSIKDGAQA